MGKKLKLYVWEDVLTDYTSGIMVALAPDVETARKLIAEKMTYKTSDLEKEPQVVTEPSAFYVYGGS